MLWTEDRGWRAGGAADAGWAMLWSLQVTSVPSSETGLCCLWCMASGSQIWSHLLQLVSLELQCLLPTGQTIEL